jgi:hypothetical protein
MTSTNIRLSRISHPRATVWAMALLVVVFLGFGIWAEAAMPTINTSAAMLDSVQPTTGWLAHITAAIL